MPLTQTNSRTSPNAYIATDLDIAEELNAVERANDLIVESIYQL